MVRNFLYFLCISFIFLSCSIKALSSFIDSDEMQLHFVVQINGVLMNDNVAHRIFSDARRKHIDIYDAKNEAIKVNIITEGTNVVISGSELMDKVAELYNSAISSDDILYLACERSEGNKVVIYVKTKERLITDIIIN